jgi:Na+-driven multidrug efflux pump
MLHECEQPHVAAALCIRVLGALIDGPVALTLLRLATPNMLVMLAQASVRLVETYFVGKLGTYPLAGVALVFPVVMLMQMMSSGAVGAAGFLRRSRAH